MSKFFVPKEFIFRQETPSDVWVIKHACGYPAVDVYFNEPGESSKMIPQKVVYISDSVLEIRFTRPFSGFAKIVG